MNTRKDKIITEAFYRSALPANILNLAILIVICITFYQTPQRNAVLLWAGIALAIIAVRQILSSTYYVKKPDKPRYWFAGLLFIVLLSGFNWGVFALTVFPDNYGEELFIIVTFTGMAVTTAVTYYMSLTVYWVFIIPALGALTFRLFVYSDITFANAGFIAVLFTVFCLVVNLIGHNRYMRVLELQFEKDELISSLKAAKDEAEEAFATMEAVAEEAREIARRAQSADETKTRFLANMSHEFLTPLNHVIGLSELALENDLDDETREYLTTVVTSARSLLEMVNNIIEFSKLDSYSEVRNLQQTSVESLVKDVLVDFHRPLEEKDLIFETAIDDQLPEIVKLDSQKLKMILSALIDNAVKFTDDGRIKISAKLKQHLEKSFLLEFAVSDTGQGIASEHHENIFESFFQVDSSSTRNYGGTGIGLALAKSLVTFLGGQIRVESEEGVGSTFSFTTNAYADSLEESDA